MKSVHSCQGPQKWSRHWDVKETWSASATNVTIHLASRRSPSWYARALKATASRAAQIDEQVGSLLSAGTGLYELDEAQLLAARPDLIIAQDLCDVCAITSSQLDHVFVALSPSPRMVTLTPRRLEDILRDIETLGVALGQEGAGRQLAVELRAGSMSFAPR